MISSVLRMLRCPVCGAECSITEDGKVCFCLGAGKHCFDFAKSGYLNLALSAKTGSGDPTDAVRVRSAFLEKGYYQPISDEVNRLLPEFGAETVLDAGCGEGYYTNRAAGICGAILGVDLSKPAIDHAAKRAKQRRTAAGFAVGSLFALPVRDRCTDAILNLFAPCAEDEFLRVMKPGSVLILVGAGERHLLGLKTALYEHPYLNPGRADLPTRMRQISHTSCRYSVTVEGQEDIQALFGMTPYAYRTGDADRKKLASLASLTTEVDFDIYCFRKEI